MLKKKRFLIGGIIIFIAVGYLLFTGFQSSATYYYTVTEVMEQGKSVYGENIKVNGEVVAGSIEQEDAGNTLNFILADGEESISVVYKGLVPDTFQAGNDTVVEGYIDTDGVFKANSILTKCPSKYEAEE